MTGGVVSVDYLSDDDQSSSRGGAGGGGGGSSTGGDNSSHGGGKDGLSSVSGHGTSGASTAGSDTNNEHFGFGLGNRLTRNVKGSKMAVLAILFLVTIGVCLAVYFITSNGQEAEFQTT